MKKAGDLAARAQAFLYVFNDIIKLISCREDLEREDYVKGRVENYA